MIQERNIELQPLTARSVVASLLLGLRQPQLSAARLVDAAALLGIVEGTTRVALSRMVAAGELTTARGQYELAGGLRERHGSQEQGRHPRLREWDGTWLLAVVGSGGAPRPAAERTTVRRVLGRLRLAEWREGVWLRPDNLSGTLPSIDRCGWLRAARFMDEDEAAEVVDRLWAPATWAEDAEHFVAALAAAPPEADLAQSFRLAAAVVRHLRDDPLLPDRMLPPDWPGARLRGAYDRYEAAIYAALRPVLGRVRPPRDPSKPTD